jgi:hypothetical protein
VKAFLNYSTVFRGPWTFESPSVYLAYNELRTGHQCPPTTKIFQKCGILTLTNDDLFSMVFITPQSQWTSRSFNLNDLDQHAPYAAYNRGFLFDETKYLPLNTTIIENQYHPYISYPKVLLSSFPQLSNCFPFTRGGYWERFQFLQPGGWDPKVNLAGMEGVLETPTMELFPTIMNASPNPNLISASEGHRPTWAAQPTSNTIKDATATTSLDKSLPSQTPPVSCKFLHLDAWGVLTLNRF